jgi:hypothetical protein
MPIITPAATSPPVVLIFVIITIPTTNWTLVHKNSIKVNHERRNTTSYKKQILITIRKYQNDHIRLEVMKVDIHRAYQMSTKDNLFKIKYDIYKHGDSHHI